MTRERQLEIDRGLAWAVPLLFFASGAFGLVYQVVWARMLGVVFGTTSLAVSTVLSAFMAGLALGSFVFGRWIDARERPLRVFGILEIGIGLYALVFPHLVELLLGTTHAWLPGGSFYMLSLVRFGLSFLLLLVPVSFMGATLPVMSRMLVRRFSRLGAGVGGLYAVNTLGAVAGVLAATFFLMEALGLRGTCYAMACGNLAVGGLAFRLGRTPMAAGKGGAPTGAVVEDAPDPAPAMPANLVKWVLAGFALSGFAALGYEVAWTRMLTLAFAANSHYEFSIILVAFLLGLSLGSFACSRFLDRVRDLALAFAAVEIFIGLLALLSIPVFAALPSWIASVRSAESWWGFRGGVFAVSAAIITVPALLMGAAFPVVSRIYTSGLDRVGRGVGDVGAANSLGAIGGAFAAGFVLMPLIGTERTVHVLAGLNLGIGLVVLGLHPRRSPRWKSGFGTIAVGVAAAILLMTPPDVLVRASSTSRDAELVHYEEGIAGIVTVDRSADGYRRLMVNGGGQVPSDYASVQLFRLLGHLPMLLHPDPQDALVVAFGGGIALGGVAQHEARRIECVEIVPEVMNAARDHFAEFNHNILDSLEAARVDIIADDGRNFLLRSDRVYDVITGDATHPTSADSWMLYTRDFYELCRDHLAADGIMAQWLPLHGLAPEDYKTILRTFQSVFPHASLWLTNDYTVVTGTVKPLFLDWNQLRQKLRAPKVRRSLEAVDLGDPFAIMSCFLMDAGTLRQYTGEGPLNSDDRPHISYAGERGFRKTGWEVLQEAGEHRVRVFPLLRNAGRGPLPAAEIERRLEAYHLGRGHVLQADLLRMRKRGRAALAEYRKALAANPEDRTAAFFVRHFSDQLISQMRAHLRVRPRDFEVRWRLGNEYARSGRWEEARKTFERLTETAPRFLKAFLSLAYLHAEMGNADLALEVFGRARDLAGDSGPARESVQAAYARIREKLGEKRAGEEGGRLTPPGGM